MAFPQAVGFLRGSVDFSLEVDLPLWSDTGKSILMHSFDEIAMGSIVKVHNNPILSSPADSGSRWHSLRLFGQTRLVFLVILSVWLVSFVSTFEPKKPDKLDPASDDGVGEVMDA